MYTQTETIIFDIFAYIQRKTLKKKGKNKIFMNFLHILQA